MLEIYITGVLSLSFLIIGIIHIVHGLNETDIYKSKKFLSFGYIIGVFFGLFFAIHVFLIGNLQCASEMTPLDVYRGKTVLKIEHRNGSEHDSTVVWKEAIDRMNIEYQNFDK